MVPVVVVGFDVLVFQALGLPQLFFDGLAVFLQGQDVCFVTVEHVFELVVHEVVGDPLLFDLVELQLVVLELRELWRLVVEAFHSLDHPLVVVELLSGCLDLAADDVVFSPDGVQLVLAETSLPLSARALSGKWFAFRAGEASS